MKLEALWIVRDPSPHSDVADICFSMPVPRLGDYVLGCPRGAWRGERHTVYTDEGEARADAEARLRARAKP